MDEQEERAIRRLEFVRRRHLMEMRKRDAALVDATPEMGWIHALVLSEALDSTIILCNLASKDEVTSYEYTTQHECVTCGRCLWIIRVVKRRKAEGKSPVSLELLHSVATKRNIGKGEARPIFSDEDYEWLGMK